MAQTDDVFYFFFGNGSEIIMKNTQGREFAQISGSFFLSFLLTPKCGKIKNN